MQSGVSVVGWGFSCLQHLVFLCLLRTKRSVLLCTFSWLEMYLLLGYSVMDRDQGLVCWLFDPGWSSSGCQAFCWPRHRCYLYSASPIPGHTHAKVLSYADCLQGLAMKGVVVMVVWLLSPGNRQMDAFVWVKEHLPFVFPLFQFVEVFL